jgi:hypothetical protein
MLPLAVSVRLPGDQCSRRRHPSIPLHTEPFVYLQSSATAPPNPLAHSPTHHSPNYLNSLNTSLRRRLTDPNRSPLSPCAPSDRGFVLPGLSAHAPRPRRDGAGCGAGRQLPPSVCHAPRTHQADRAHGLACIGVATRSSGEKHRNRAQQHLFPFPCVWLLRQVTTPKSLWYGTR